MNITQLQAEPLIDPEVAEIRRQFRQLQAAARRWRPRPMPKGWQR